LIEHDLFGKPLRIFRIMLSQRGRPDLGGLFVLDDGQITGTP
jgi:hypothetical protein